MLPYALLCCHMFYCVVMCCGRYDDCGMEASLLLGEATTLLCFIFNQLVLSLQDMDQFRFVSKEYQLHIPWSLTSSSFKNENCRQP